MKKLVLLAALTAGISLTANANELSDYLDSQYELSWAEETTFQEFQSAGIVDPLLAYQTEGNAVESDSGFVVTGRVVDIAVMEIVAEPMSEEDRELLDGYE